jgi:AcrR family transcriptional regulator
VNRRRYELKERARRQEETRQRIIDTTVALHREVGPAKTTVSEIARRAGVGRVTVYNHFPDDASLLGACSARFIAGHPPPDPSAWEAIDDPERRLRAALTELYAWFRANEAMLANVRRDAALIPALAAVVSSAEATAHETAMREALLAGRGRRRRVRAAIGLALAFPTWQRLARDEGLSDGEAVEVMAAAVAAA